MSKFFITLLTLGVTVFANSFETELVSKHNFNNSLKTNAEVIQLANSQQSVSALASGRLIKYYVQPAQKVLRGQKIALLDSIELSKMSAEYLSLRGQLSSAKKNYETSKELYSKGMGSVEKLNNNAIKKSEIEAKLTSVNSQLKTLGIDAQSLKTTISKFTLYAHSEGIVSELLKPLHSSVNVNEPLVRLVKNQAYYIRSYIPLKYAQNIALGDRVSVEYGGSVIQTKITQILPKLDKLTQRIIVLSKVQRDVKNLFINTYLEARVYFKEAQGYVAIKKTALSFFNNEWVVFVVNEHNDEKHDDHSDDEKHDDHGNDEKHDEHGDDEKHDDHGDDEKLPYEARVVQIIVQDEEYVGVKGVQEGEVYISKEPYEVKSLLLKSSLGGHGH